MPVSFKGENLNGTAESDLYSLPFNISFFTVANKNGGATIVNISVTDDTDEILIAPQNLQLEEGDMLQGDYRQLLQGGWRIKVVSNANVDYQFTIENIEAV